MTTAIARPQSGLLSDDIEIGRLYDYNMVMDAYNALLVVPQFELKLTGNLTVIRHTGLSKVN